jgi:hypothetical protein
MAQPMMASQIRDMLDDIINDQGDFPCFTADALEPEWRSAVTSVDYERDRESILIAAAD